MAKNTITRLDSLVNISAHLFPKEAGEPKPAESQRCKICHRQKRLCLKKNYIFVDMKSMRPPSMSSRAAPGGN